MPPRITISDFTVDVRTRYASEHVKIEEHMLNSIRQNHVEGGRPTPWMRLATGAPSHLSQTGAMQAGHRSDSGENYSEVTATSWAGTFIHQFGGWTGRGHLSYIPPRPYMLIQVEDREFAADTIGSAIFYDPTKQGM